MFIVKELKNINLDDLNINLSYMGIDKLFIFVVNNDIGYGDICRIESKKNPNVIYYEMNSTNFINFLNSNENNRNFLDYNKHSIFIVRNSKFKSIKNLFSKIHNCNVNMGRGGSQKSHGLSTLDLRLTSYLMAMFDFDFKLISYLNTFNSMTKDRYLSYLDSTSFKQVSLDKEYRPIVINKMPSYCNNKDLGRYFSECTEIKG
jgi:hypothetical protein